MTEYSAVLATCLSKSSRQMIDRNPFLLLSEERIAAVLDELDGLELDHD